MKEIIKNCENRLVSYKQLLSEFARLDVPDWYKELLRENKNNEQVYLKKLVEERTYENEGLNPPYCYKWKKIM